MDDQEERALTDVLRARRPRYPAPASLTAKLAAQVDALEEEPRAERPRRRPRASWAIAAAALLALAVAALVFGVRSLGRPSPLVAEAVNDHLRVLYADRPLEIESGGIHQVKPWFAGKLDFAPRVSFEGDDDFPLQGGAVAFFVDRKAAAFIYKRRLHVITLFVFRSEGLPWSNGAALPMGRVRVETADARGFHVVLWRDGDLGYALVSDVDTQELLNLGKKIVGP
jgi:anti-sigma factor RsiW